jgi:hypothetical protein
LWQLPSSRFCFQVCHDDYSKGIATCFQLVTDN